MRNRRRGSVFVFTVVMVLMTTTLIVATSLLTGSTRSSEFRRERDATAQASFLGVLDQIKADSGTSILTLPIVNNYTSGGQTWSVTVSDNSASIPRSVLVTASATISRTQYKQTSVVVQRFTANPLNYCLATNSSITPFVPITTGSGGANGDIYVHGALSFPLIGQSTVNGTIETTGATVNGNVTVTGTETTNATVLAFPAVTPATYQANANTVYANGTSLNNVNFPAPSGSNYPIYYINGGGRLKGAITGQGVIFVNGNLNIQGNITYANGSSRLAVIANGNINVPGNCINLVGYWYSTGNINLTAALSRTVTGALAGNSINCTGPLNITYDSDIFTYPSEGKKFCLPGFWP